MINVHDVSISRGNEVVDKKYLAIIRVYNSSIYVYTDFLITADEEHELYEDVLEDYINRTYINYKFVGYVWCGVNDYDYKVVEIN